MASLKQLTEWEYETGSSDAGSVAIVGGITGTIVLKNVVGGTRIRMRYNVAGLGLSTLPIGISNSLETDWSIQRRVVKGIFGKDPFEPGDFVGGIQILTGSIPGPKTDPLNGKSAGVIQWGNWTQPWPKASCFTMGAQTGLPDISIGLYVGFVTSLVLT
jgi:hypothetical protein